VYEIEARVYSEAFVATTPMDRLLLDTVLLKNWISDAEDYQEELEGTLGTICSALAPKPIKLLTDVCFPCL